MALWDELPGREVTAQEIAAKLPAGDEDDDDSLVAVWVPKDAVGSAVETHDGRTMYDHDIGSFILERPSAYYAVDLGVEATLSIKGTDDDDDESEWPDDYGGLSWALIDRVKHEHFENMPTAPKSKTEILVELNDSLLYDSADEWTLAAAAGYGEKYARVGPEGNAFRGMADTKHFTELRDLNELLVLVPDPSGIYGDIRILPEEHEPGELHDRLIESRKKELNEASMRPSGSVSHTGPGTRHGAPVATGSLRNSIGTATPLPESLGGRWSSTGDDDDDDDGGSSIGDGIRSKKMPAEAEYPAHPSFPIDRPSFQNELVEAVDFEHTPDGERTVTVEMENGSTIELPKLTDREMAEAAANYGHTPESISDSLDALRDAMDGMPTIPTELTLNISENVKDKLRGMDNHFTTAYGLDGDDADDDDGGDDE